VELTYHFRKLVRAQVLLGIVAFCIAEQNPMMLVAAGSLALLSWYIVEGPTGKPLPRWAINIGAVAAVAWLLMDIFSLHQGQIIIAMGHFTIWLQILELYANKTNRDYGLILVLSLTQMVGASILSVSIIYGVLLVAYCVLALFTVLIFHFKSINDFVNEANRSASAESDAVPRPKPVVGRGYRWQFRLTAGAVGGMCAVIAVIVFLLLPRRAPVGSTSGLHGPQGPPTVGFSSQVRLGGPAPRVGSREPIMHVAIDRDGENAGSNDTTFHIRGIALDRYDPYRHTWERSSPATLRDAQLRFDDDGFIGFAELREDVSTYHAQFTLRAASGGVLFTLHPVAELRSVALDAVQRVYAYILARPARLAAYALSAALIGMTFEPDAGAAVVGQEFSVLLQFTIRFPLDDRLVEVEVEDALEFFTRRHFQHALAVGAGHDLGLRRLGFRLHDLFLHRWFGRHRLFFRLLCSSTTCQQCHRHENSQQTTNLCYCHD